MNYDRRQTKTATVSPDTWYMNLTKYEDALAELQFDLVDLVDDGKLLGFDLNASIALVDRVQESAKDIKDKLISVAAHEQKMSDPKIRALKTKILHLVWVGGGIPPEDIHWRTDYSGRGMFGAVSPLAFTIPIHPNMPAGLKLRAIGLSYDSMGKDYIYYLR